MSMFWLAPAALFGLVLVGVPVAIHLLVRQQSRRVDFPSLRFVQPSALAAFRRRTIQDAMLLLCRSAVVIAAVLALAGPVWQTASRAANQADRVARAVVVVPGAAPGIGEQARAGSYVSQIFARAELVDAIASANRWLDEQPPASREIVFAGRLRRDSLTRGDLAAVPSTTGIRFVAATAVPGVRDVVVTVLRSEAGQLVIDDRPVHLGDDQTRVSAETSTPAPADMIRIVAAPADQRLADAALRAALGAGLRWTRRDQKVLVIWEGADEATLPRQADGVTAVRMRRPVVASTSASAIAAAVEQVTATPMQALEPVGISTEQLEAWSRPPGGVPADARPADEGDRRWLWGLTLGLLGVEYVMRRAVKQQATVDADVEARVA
jgi:hypothetical protein